MDKCVLYCKSYIRDLNRLKVLLESVKKFNIDNLPFYISVPTSDIDAVRNSLGSDGYILISDDQIAIAPGGWVGQEIIKTQFWRLGLCENYLCIDSDCQFIRPFYLSDFMYDDDTPYTVCHEYKTFFEYMDKNPIGFDPYESFVRERKQIMELFGRTGLIYDFGPGPNIWSCKVWQSFDENYIIPNKLTFESLIKSNPSEVTWYGEYLMVTRIIPLIPRGPMFKSYHYKSQYLADKESGYTIDQMSKQYLGIGLQSNWQAPLFY